MRPHPGFQICTSSSLQHAFPLSMLLTTDARRAFYPPLRETRGDLGISAVDDQMLGGGLVWSGAHMYLLPILLILYGLSRGRERAAPA